MALLASGACGAPPLPESDQLRVVEGCVALPEGVKATAVLNALEEVKTDADGCFALHMAVGGPQLTLALNGRGTPVRMGWISPDRPTLDARVTAEALTWWAVGGPLTGLEGSLKLFDALAVEPAVDEVADALDAALADDANAFAKDDATFAAVLGSVSQRLLADKPAEDDTAGTPTSYAVLVNPGGTQSGVRVQQSSGVNAITFTNTLRREGHAYVERVATYDAGGVPTDAKAAITDLPVPSVRSLTGWADGFSQIVTAAYSPGGLEGSEDVAYVPRNAGPVNVDNVEGAAKTRYRVLVVGPGLGDGVVDDLTPEQEEARALASAVFLVKDFVLPLVVQHLIPRLGAGDAAGNELVDGLAQDIGKLFLQQIPQAVQLMADGDPQGAIALTWDTLVSNNTVRDVIFDQIIEHWYDFSSAGLAAGSDRAIALAQGFAKATGAVDALLTAGDASFLITSVLSADKANEWTVDVTDANVRFDPPEATVYPESSVRLTVNVIDAGDDAVFEYRFATPGAFGTLANDLHRGPEVTSSQPWIDYEAGADEGTDTVTVEVYEVRLSDRVKVGEASASVEVDDNCATATPQTAVYERVDTHFTCFDDSACDKSYFLWRFRAVEGVFQYIADIDTHGNDFNGVTTGQRTLNRYADTGQPYRYYHDERSLEIYKPGLFDARGIAAGERLYLPAELLEIFTDVPENAANYAENRATWDSMFSQVDVRITPVCPPE
ncbi:MAG: hypothetical protein H6733_14270 [Alphaproteobacteria bacterium]|nr:hypothetical protein [Alphaproteobacteria bacterium]